MHLGKTATVNLLQDSAKRMRVSRVSTTSINCLIWWFGNVEERFEWEGEDSDSFLKLHFRLTISYQQIGGRSVSERAT
jgi:hypothetical protein